MGGNIDLSEKGKNEMEPKIIQLIPVNNWWIRYRSSDENGNTIPDKFHYGRVAFFALVEKIRFDETDQDIIPIDFDKYGMWELDCANRDGWFYSEEIPEDDD